MATRILVLATKNEKLGASWPHDFFLKVEHWLIVVDYFSRYYEIKILFSTTSEKITESLERIFMIHGKTTPLWPKANSEVERQN